MLQFLTYNIPSAKRTSLSYYRRYCKMTTTNTHSVVLGTSSKWRRALFTQHFPDIPFTFAKPDIDESAAGGSRIGADPQTLTLKIARAKADALLPQFKNTCSLLITLDQVVVVDGVVREKPANRDMARQYLLSYATLPVTTVTSVVIHNCANGHRVDDIDEASLVLRPLPTNVIDALLDKGDVLHSAGGVTVEDELVVPFHQRLDGELESILGLPVSCLRRLLQLVAVTGTHQK